MLEYLYREGEPACSKEPLKVRLDGRVVGEIRKVVGGYQYFPKASTYGGEVMPSIALVQRSLADE
jgi:hypothetical protein